MRILVTNDDGIDSPWLVPVAETAKRFGQVTVVAPAGQCSAMSQRITCREAMDAERQTDFPIEGVEAWSLTGTPTDCVKIALHYLMREKPDFVFTGMNIGCNAGYDIAFSGTLGAALEARRQGIPAIAFSCECTGTSETAETWMSSIAEELMEKDAGPGMVWNVNFPGVAAKACKGILRDRTVAPLQFYADHYCVLEQQDGFLKVIEEGHPVPPECIPEGSDIAAVMNGYISVGKVNGNL